MEINITKIYLLGILVVLQAGPKEDRQNLTKM